jgi:hypothetical protein
VVTQTLVTVRGRLIVLAKFHRAGLDLVVASCAAQNKNPCIVVITEFRHVGEVGGSSDLIVIHPNLQ